MLDLSNFKGDILKNILQELSGIKLEDAPNYISITYDLPPVNIHRLLNFIHGNQFCYFKNKTGDEEYLAVGKIDDFGPKELNTLGKALKDNPEVKAFGGLRFSTDEVGQEWKGFGEKTFFIPLIEWSRLQESHFLKVNFPKAILTSEETKAAFIFELEDLLGLDTTKPSFLSAGSLKYSEQLDVPEKDTWNKNIDFCLNNFKDSDLKKVVLARKKIYLQIKGLSPIQLFSEISNDAKNAYSFYLQMDGESAFMSTTPERLFHIEENKLTIDSIAGTRPRGKTPDEDYIEERELKTSKKDIDEHRIVSQEIHHNLMGFCHSIKTLCNEKILKLNHVQHLQTIFEGTLNEDFNLDEILYCLHPTPAVGGSPKKMAMELIEKLENFDRGLYASPIGYLSYNKSEIAVGIRSALFNNSSLHVFGGAGIVPGSEGPKEWLETQSKMKNFII
jgi:menaquinone-specific isochorismate synthase